MRAFLRSLWLWPVVALATACFGLLSLAASLGDRSGTASDRCMRAWAAFLLRVGGVRTELRGAERIPAAGRGLILVCNHQGMADILALIARLPLRFSFVAKKELFRIPFLGWHMRRCGFIPIDRGQPGKNIEPLAKAQQALEEGKNILFFPEGTRSPDGRIQRFRRGAFELAKRSRSPIVPLAISGSWQVLAKGRWLLRPGAIRLQVAPPFEASSFSGDAIAMASAVQRIVATNCENN